MVSDQDISAMARMLGGRFGADAVVLFGSHARHEAGDHSDVDLLVVMPEEVADADRLYIEMRKMITPRWPVPLDLVIRSREAVRKWQSVPYSVIHEAIKRGKILYGHRPG